MPLAMADHASTPIYLQPCGSCGGALKPTQINLTHLIYLCADHQCPYPLNTGRAERFMVASPVLSQLAGPISHQHATAQHQHKQRELTEYKKDDFSMATSHHAPSGGCAAPAHSAALVPPVRSASSALAALRRGNRTAQPRNATSSSLTQPPPAARPLSQSNSAALAAFTAAAVASATAQSLHPAAFSPSLQSSLPSSSSLSDAYQTDWLQSEASPSPAAPTAADLLGDFDFSSSAQFPSDPYALHHTLLDDFGQQQSQHDSEIVWE